MPNKGYVYAVILREFVHMKKCVFKFGCTKDAIRRYGDYPKGSMLVFTQIVDNYAQVEKDILAKLKGIFYQRTDIGREYFEGSSEHMLDVIKQHLESPKNLFEEESNNTHVEDAACDRMTDPDIIIDAFMKIHKVQLNNQIMRSADVYEMYTRWAEENRPLIGKRISHKRFSTGLKEAFRVETKPYRIDDGVARAMCFQSVADPTAKEELEFEEFVASAIQKANGTWFTLKQARELYSQSPYAHVRFIGSKLKTMLEETLQTQCCLQKKIAGVNYTNVFYGFRLEQPVNSNNV